MSDFDLSKLQNLKFDVSKIALERPQIDTSFMRDMTRQNEELFRSIAKEKERREAEELRRHNEMIAALKEAGEKGATIVVGDNATGIQIQQNSAGASQYMTNNVGLDYEKTLKVLKEIKEYFDFPKFQETFGENTENIKAVVESTIKAVEARENEGLIKKSLHVLKDLIVGTTGSLIASGILGLLRTLPI